jgi:hypothetical protein
VQGDNGDAAPGLEAEVAVAASGPCVDELGEGGVGEAMVGRPEVHGEGRSRGVVSQSNQMTFSYLKPHFDRYRKQPQLCRLNKSGCTEGFKS